jgi:hypothetical protein
MNVARSREEVGPLLRRLLLLSNLLLLLLRRAAAVAVKKRRLNHIFGSNYGVRRTEKDTSRWGAATHDLWGTEESCVIFFADFMFRCVLFCKRTLEK